MKTCDGCDYLINLCCEIDGHGCTSENPRCEEYFNSQEEENDE